MKVFSGLIRSLLNINTIWGLMILISFVLCAVQHYQPTTSRLSSSLLDDGSATLAIYIGDDKRGFERFEVTLEEEDGAFVVPDRSDSRADGSPWLIAARRDEQAIAVTWDYVGYGQYLMAVERSFRPGERVPDRYLSRDRNALHLRQTTADGAQRTFTFRFRRSGDTLSVDSVDGPVGVQPPYLDAVHKAEDGFLLTWQHCKPGECVLVAEELVAKGKLVTLKSLTDAAFDFAAGGFNIALGLVAAMVMLLGLMRVGEKAGIVQLVARGMYPVIRFLFPQVPKDHPANGAIVMNVTSTLLGLGNAATPFGLKAMKELQTLNDRPEVATDSQIMLLGYNTAGLAILPTTLLGVRQAAQCSDPAEIIGTCMLAGAVATVTAIIMVKLLGRLPMFSRAAAVAEYDREAAANRGSEKEGKA
jgi:spore maturation protein A